MGPERKLRLTARNRRLVSLPMVYGSGPITRPGTTESSARAARSPMDRSSRPIKPGEPARGSPSESATTRLPVQNTPEKEQGSRLKSHDSKKCEPGISSSALRTDCRARKSTGFSNPIAESILAAAKKKIEKRAIICREPISPSPLDLRLRGFKGVALMARNKMRQL